MKSILTGILFFLPHAATAQSLPKGAENIVIITLDGFRWQEIFSGADTVLLSHTRYTPDTATLQSLYGGDNATERRMRLLPFFWNIIAKKGQLYGNRVYNNKVNVANPYAISYPGYSEIFSGYADISISTNKRKNNPNMNVLEYLHTKEAFKGKVAAFTSWDVFPYIFNDSRHELPVNSGYAIQNTANLDFGEALLQKVQQEAVYEKEACRHDLLTFLTAKEYLQKYQPRVLYIGFGETDEAAHSRRYDLYLEKASQADRMLAELWRLLQTTPVYKDNTVLLITTDHGRGSRPDNWGSHGFFIKGSSETWMAALGPGIPALGEVKEKQQWYQKQIAQTIAEIMGEDFSLYDQPVASSIPITQLH